MLVEVVEDDQAGRHTDFFSETVAGTAKASPRNPFPEQPGEPYALALEVLVTLRDSSTVLDTVQVRGREETFQLALPRRAIDLPLDPSSACSCGGRSTDLGPSWTNRVAADERGETESCAEWYRPSEAKGGMSRRMASALCSGRHSGDKGLNTSPPSTSVHLFHTTHNPGACGYICDVESEIARTGATFRYYCAPFGPSLASPSAVLGSGRMVVTQDAIAGAVAPLSPHPFHRKRGAL